MKRAGIGPWLALAVVGAWCAALQGWVGTQWPELWAPDLVLVLYFAVAPRLDVDGSRFAALFIALARCGFSIDPPVAVFAAYLGVAGVHGALRSTLDLESLSARATLAAVSAPAVAAWLFAVHAVRTDVELSTGPPLLTLAAATALATVCVGPVLAHLPVLRRLETRRR